MRRRYARFFRGGAVDSYGDDTKYDEREDREHLLISRTEKVYISSYFQLPGTIDTKFSIKTKYSSWWLRQRIFRMGCKPSKFFHQKGKERANTSPLTNITSNKKQDEEPKAPNTSTSSHKAGETSKPTPQKQHKESTQAVDNPVPAKSKKDSTPAPSKTRFKAPGSGDAKPIEKMQPDSTVIPSAGTANPYTSGSMTSYSGSRATGYSSYSHGNYGGYGGDGGYGGNGGGDGGGDGGGGGGD